jgi:hypothetical protein
MALYVRNLKADERARLEELLRRSTANDELA